MTTLRRLTSLMAVIAMLLTLTAIPAFAVAQGSATITTGDLLSGQGGNVNLRITNDASGPTLGLVGGGSSINAFVIEVPQDLVSVAAADVALPSGWTGGYDDEIGFIFAEAGNGSALAPGSSLDVGIGVTALAIPDDRTRGFTTSVSDNRGVTLSDAGSPQVTSRILEVLDTVLHKPSEATNDNAQQVTAHQDNAFFSVTVANHGTQSRTVEADVVRVAGSSSLDTTAGSATIGSGGSDSIDVPATFGNAGSLTVDGTAASASSTANAFRAEALTVQAPFTAALVADSLQPEATAPGATTDIQYRINKTAGAQPVTADATFSFCGVTVTEPQSFDAANGQKTVLFPGVVIPDLANGDCSTTSTIDGIDANGATVDLTLEPGILSIDNLIPVVDLDLNVGASDVPNTTPATTNGRSITYSGSITLAGDSGACGDCTITEAVLVTAPGENELPMNVTNNNGTLSGSQSFTFPAGTTSAVAHISVERDTTGATGESTSNTIVVDLVAPDLDGPGETRRGAANDQIVIDLGDDGEFVDVSDSSTRDWSVQGNTVTAVEGAPSSESASQVILTLQNRLGDNATPQVTYSPALLLLGGVVHDRVSLEVVEQVVETVDRIAPAAPVINTVNGMARQDGEFYINDSTPEVSLSSLATGTVLELYYDTNGDGVPQAGERVHSGPVNGNTATVTLSDLGNVDQSHDLIARLKDDAGNLGDLASAVLNLDFTLPQITDFSVDGQQVTVSFDEPLPRGRDAAFDWTVLAIQDGTTAHRTVTEVVQGADSTQRVLTVNAASWDATAAGAEVLGVRYKFRGAEGERYEDRATNLFDDVLFTEE